MFKRIAENKIQAAMEAGVFDNLAGKGKPLRLEDNPYEPAEQRAANHLLKNNGFTLPWIEVWNEIERERAAARSELRRLRERAILDNRPLVWELARVAFANQVGALNRRILGYNLSVPSPQFQKALIDPESELRQALDLETP